jgi:hypothetical protein
VSRSFLHRGCGHGLILSCSSEFESSAGSQAVSEFQTDCRLGRKARNSGLYIHDVHFLFMVVAMGSSRIAAFASTENREPRRTVELTSMR